jgi:CelD/BcsL family acetyltransferase involved in cellulose biosynthesis
MALQSIATIEQLERIRSDWEHVYANDTQANIFLAWPWLRAHLATIPYPWQVLVFTSAESAAPVAFLPVITAQRREHGIALERQLYLRGYRRADYTGMLSMPAQERDAIAAFVPQLRNAFVWDTLRLDNILDSRIETLANAFAEEGFRVNARETKACPFLRLPKGWREYLNQRSTDTRHTLRTTVHKVEHMPGHRLIFADENNIDQQIETLLLLHSRRSKTNLAEDREDYTTFLRECLSTGCLYLITLWDGSTPIAGLAGFTDGVKRTFALYLTGHDDAYGDVSPGRYVIARSIYDSINAGLKIYDFLIGNEQYKFYYGSEDRFAHTTVVTRPGIRTSLLDAGRNWVRAVRRVRAGLR